MPKPQFPSFTAPSALDTPGLGAVAVALRTICAQLNDCFTMLQGYLRRTPSVEYVDATSPATADEPFRVSHNLGATPRFVSAIMEAAGGVYATRDDRATGWTTTYVIIRCPVANCGMVVEVKS